jgi:hypothetical protein
MRCIFLAFFLHFFCIFFAFLHFFRIFFVFFNSMVSTRPSTYLFFEHWVRCQLVVVLFFRTRVRGAFVLLLFWGGKDSLSIAARATDVCCLCRAWMALLPDRRP